MNFDVLVLHLSLTLSGLSFKTTTINCLTGMVAPTSGHAIVAGKDTHTQMNQIRKDVGICLQHDCLFPNLTVKEHIEFFARIKGMYGKMSKAEAEKKVLSSIEDVALLEKRNTLAKSLSGGMKRKLSVAIAFCGDSKTVLCKCSQSAMCEDFSSYWYPTLTTSFLIFYSGRADQWYVTRKQDRYTVDSRDGWPFVNSFLLCLSS